MKIKKKTTVESLKTHQFNSKSSDEIYLQYPLEEIATNEVISLHFIHNHEYINNLKR